MNEPDYTNYRLELNEMWCQLWEINDTLRRLTRNEPTTPLERDHAPELMSAKVDVVNAQDTIKALVDSIDSK